MLESRSYGSGTDHQKKSGVTLLLLLGCVREVLCYVSRGWHYLGIAIGEKCWGTPQVTTRPDEVNKHCIELASANCVRTHYVSEVRFGFGPPTPSLIPPSALYGLPIEREQMTTIQCCTVPVIDAVCKFTVDTSLANRLQSAMYCATNR
jgi:hypothetical protein